MNNSQSQLHNRPLLDKHRPMAIEYTLLRSNHSNNRMTMDKVTIVYM